MAYTIVSTDETTTQTLANNDSFILTREGSVFVSGGHGISATGTNNATDLTIAGEVIARNHGIYLDGTTTDEETGVGSHRVHVSTTGSVTSLFGSQHAIFTMGSANTITNEGEIVSGGSAIRNWGDGGTITNTGSVTSYSSSAVYLQGTTSGNAYLNNSGTLFSAGFGGAVKSVNNDLELINSGSIHSSGLGVYAYSNGDTITLDLVNTGTIEGSYSIYTDDGADTVQNFGFLIGGVNLRDGANDFNNSGTLLGSYLGGADDETVVNSGVISENVNLYSGADVFDGRGGVVNGYVDGGFGDDIYYVSDNKTTLVENAGQGTDTVFSEGRFTLGDNFENLELIGTDDIFGSGNELDNTITGNTGDNRILGRDGDDMAYGGDGNDVLRGQKGKDTLYGGDESDNIFGGGAADKIYGDAGEDTLRGGAGNDKLYGGDDDDILYSDIGADEMTGGANSDTFVFTSIGHSTNDSSADKILDFELDIDHIDLSNINGNLTFIGSDSFTGSGPEVRLTDNGTKTTIRIDADGDGSADMKIFIEDVVGLDAADFIL